MVLLEGTTTDAWRPLNEIQVNRVDGATTFTAQRAYTSGVNAQNKILADVDGSGREVWTAPRDVDIITTQSLLRVDPSTFSTVQEYANLTTSAGWLAGGTITDNGNGTVNVTAGSGFLRSAASPNAPIYFTSWIAATVAVTVNTLTHIGVSWTSTVAAPVVSTRSTSNWDYLQNFPLGVVQRFAGLPIQVVDHRHVINDSDGLTARRFHELEHVARDEFGAGLALGETGTRNVTVTAGALWVSLIRAAIPSINTSAGGTFRRYYRDGVGGFTEQLGQTQWDNTQYDDGSGTLATITGVQYSQQWFYLGFDGSLYSIYGRNQAPQSATIEAIGPPTPLPKIIENHGILIGRIIFQKNNATATKIESAFGQKFTPTLVADHGNLGGLADDDHPQYLLQDATEPMLANWNAGNIRISALAMTLGAAGTGEITVQGAGVFGKAEQFGKGAKANAEDGLVVGWGSVSDAPFTIVIGVENIIAAPFHNCIVLGSDIVPTGSRQFIVGGPVHYVENMFIGRGPTHASPPPAVNWQVTGGSGVDVAGSTLNIVSGRGTGGASGGAIDLRVSQPGIPTLSVLNPDVSVLKIDGFNVTHNTGAGLGNFDVAGGGLKYTGLSDNVTVRDALIVGPLPHFISDVGEFQAGDADRKFVMTDSFDLFGTITTGGSPDTVFGWGDGNANLINFNKDEVNTLIFGDASVTSQEMTFWDAINYRTEQKAVFNLRGEVIFIAAGVATGKQSCIAVAPESGSADDLDTISLVQGTPAEGDLMIVKSSSGSTTITVKHATGNIRLDGSADKVLNNLFDRLVLQFDSDSGGAWCQISFSNNG